MEEPRVPVTEVVQGWANRRNRQIFVRIFTRATLALAALALFAVAFKKLPDILKRIGGAWPESWPKHDKLFLVFGIVALVIAFAIAATSTLSYYRRRTLPRVLARTLDAKHQTADLLTTAIAVENGETNGTYDLGAAVLERAHAFTVSIPAPTIRKRPARAYLATMGLATLLGGLVAFVPLKMIPKDLLHGGAPDDPEQPADPKLADEDRQKLEQLEKQLSAMEKQQGLRDSARKKLQEARQELNAAKGNSSRSAGHLSAAERTLQDLANEARDQGGLYDNKQLESQPTDTITQQLADAVQRGDSQTTGAMGEELIRRAKNAPSDAALKQIGNSLDRALAKSGANPSNVDPKDLSKWRDLAQQAGKHLDDGEVGHARSKLRELADDMGMKSEPLEGALSGINGIRSKQMTAMNNARNPGGQNGQNGQQTASNDPGKQGQNGQNGQGTKPGNGTKPGQNGQNGQGQQGQKGQGQQGQNGQNGQGQQGQNGQNGQGQQGQNGQNQNGNGNSNDPNGTNDPGGTNNGTGDNEVGQGGTHDIGPGSHNHGDPRSLFGHRPIAERVQVARRGALPGAVGAIERHEEGGDDREYQDLVRDYSDIAEGTIKSEQIPLARRDYIRHYFEALRPSP